MSDDTLTPEREKEIRSRAEVGMKVDPKNDVVGQDYVVLLNEIDRLRRVAEDRRQAIMDLHDQIRMGRP